MKKICNACNGVGRSMAAGAAMLLCVAVMAADEPPTQQTLPDTQRTSDIALADAMRLIESGQGEAAKQSLQQIIDAEATDDLSRYAAAVLADQIAGGQKARQQRWLKRKVVDVLVLVADEASFLAAIGVWDEQTFFPVLIDDGWYAPMFARAFGPAKVVRWSSKERIDADKLLDQLITRENERIRQLPAVASPPPGIVVIDTKHPLRFAAAALALGRGQPAIGVDSPGAARQMSNPEKVSQLNNLIMPQVVGNKLLTDRQWVGITLAGEYPYRYQITAGNKKETLAVDDLLGREARGLRLGVVGRLYGSLEQGIYQAMCSLFVQPKQALLFDDYANRTNPGIENYRMERAAEILGEKFNVTMLAGGETTPGNFRRLTHIFGSEDGFGLIWINTSGTANYMELNGKQLHAGPEDMPIGYPAAIHFTHSFSMQRVYDEPGESGLAGRAMLGGAFWYYGSVDEPYMEAFARPTGMAVKAMAGTPLGFAARHTIGQSMYRPWKLMLVGDPLYCLRDEPAERVRELPLEDVETLTLAEATKLPVDELFRRVLVLKPEVAATVAMKAIEEPDKLKPGELAMAMWLLNETRQQDLYAGVSGEAASGHPYAMMAMRESTIAAFNGAIKAGRPQDAQKPLVKLVQLESERRAIAGHLRVWLAEMSKIGQGEHATEFLRDLGETKTLSRNARRAIQDVLAVDGSK